MKEVDGYVCIGKLDDHTILYGPSSEEADKQYQALTTNDFTPFPTHDLAQAALKIIIETNTFQEVIIETIRMSIAEDLNEVDSLSEEALIVLARDAFGWQIFGKYVEGRPSISTLPCGYFQQNGLLPFSDKQRANEAASQILRQGQMKPLLASIKLEKIEE